jgi:phytoene dehydrogenase-like protein
VIVVIGAGVNGLVAATVLAREGRQVTLVERRPVVGGLCATLDIAPGYRAPLCGTAPPMHADVMRATGLDLPGGLNAIRPSPALSIVAADGRLARIFDDVERTARGLREISAQDAVRWPEYVETCRRLARVFDGLNRHAPPDIDRPSLSEVLRLLSTARQARQLGKRDLARLLRYVPMAAADIAAEWFDSDALQSAVAAQGVRGHLAGPWSAGTGAILLQRLAMDAAPFGSGATWRGGPGALAAVLAARASAAGARIRTDTRAVQVLIADGRATAVVLESGEEIAAEAVVAAIDPKQLFLSLVEPAALPPSFLERMRHVRARGVTTFLALALDGLPASVGRDGTPAPADARMLFAGSIDHIERAFDAAKYGAASPAPWFDVTVPTLQDPTLSPPGGHVMVVAVHCTPRDLRAGTWATERDAVADRAIASLTDYFPGLDSRIVARAVVTPEDLERDWGLSGGHLDHGELTADQWWVARPFLGSARYATPVEGLFLAGAGAHPGGHAGLPGLLAARSPRLRA